MDTFDSLRVGQLQASVPFIVQDKSRVLTQDSHPTQHLQALHLWLSQLATAVGSA